MGNKTVPFLAAIFGGCLVAGAAFFYQKKKDGEPRGPMAEPQPNVQKELVKRMPDLIYYDRFLLAVQPVVDLQTGGIVGGEVLSRLNHPEQGIIFPDKFLPVLEEAGLCLKFDHYIFRKSCELMQSLIRQGVVIQYLSCNFSRLTLSEKGIAARLSKIADEYGLPHNCMAVEVTELDRETDGDQFQENLIDLKKEGFRIFVDDLGAGVTSVRDMWSYPVDVIKIDRSLLLAAENDQGRSAYRVLRNLAVDLGCKVLCEGVETEEQHRFVLDVGCDYCQGFLFYKPMEAEQFRYLMGGRA